MSDNLRQYRAIRDALNKYPASPKPVRSHLPPSPHSSVASCQQEYPPAQNRTKCLMAKPESRVKRFARWSITPTSPPAIFPYA